MRVLVIANDFPHASRPHAGIFVLRQVEALRRLGWQPKVIRFVPWAPPVFGRWKHYLEIPASYEYAGIPVSVTRVMLLPRFGLIEYIGAQTHRFVLNQMSVFNPHVIHAHQILPTGLMAIGHGCPVVVTAHGSDAYDYPYRSSSFRKSAEKVATSADKVVAVSRFVAKHVERFGAHEVEVVFNGADPEVFCPADRRSFRTRLLIGNDRNVIAFAGHIGEAKGIFELVEAIGYLKDLNPLLLIAGSGGAQSLVQEQLVQRGIDHRFCGLLQQRDLAVLVGAADVVSLPSHREGLPTIVCEAMLASRTVVATDVGGIPEIITDRETGFIVPVKDPGSLADALREALVNRPLKEAIERRAYEFAASHLTWSANACAYDRIFRSLISRPGSSDRGREFPIRSKSHAT